MWDMHRWRKWITNYGEYNENRNSSPKNSVEVLCFFGYKSVTRNKYYLAIGSIARKVTFHNYIVMNNVSTYPFQICQIPIEILKTFYSLLNSNSSLNNFGKSVHIHEWLYLLLLCQYKGKEANNVEDYWTGLTYDCSDRWSIHSGVRLTVKR